MPERSLFLLQRARQERLHSLRDRQHLVQHVGHRRGDRHLHPVLLREPHRRPRRRHPLDRPALGRGRARAQRMAEREVARLRRVAGQRQVPEPRKPGQRLGLRAQRRHQPRHLGEAARHQRRLRARPQSRALHHAAGDGDHVLQGPAELRPRHVLGQVEPQPRRRQQALQQPPDRRIGTGERQRRRQPARDLGRESRPGQHRAGLGGAVFRRDLGLQPEIRAADPLGAQHQRHRWQPIAMRAQEALGLLRRQRQQQRLRLGQCPQLRHRHHRLGQRHPRQPQRVLPRLGHGRHRAGIAAPQHHR